MANVNDESHCDWIHGFPGLFADTSEHIFLVVFSFYLFYTFQLLVPCGRLSWLTSAFKHTLKSHLVSYPIVWRVTVRAWYIFETCEFSQNTTQNTSRDNLPCKKTGSIRPVGSSELRNTAVWRWLVQLRRLRPWPGERYDATSTRTGPLQSKK